MLRSRTTATVCFSITDMKTKRKRGVLHCRSLLALRSFHGTFVIGTNNKRRPTQFVYINNPAVPKVAIGVGVHQWPWHNEGCVYHNHGAFTATLFWQDVLKFSQDFRASKPKRSKRLSICLVAHTTHPQGIVARVTVRNYNLILN